MRSIIHRLRSAEFWRSVAERAFANAWQALTGLAIIAPGMALGDIDWRAAAGYSITAAVVALGFALVELPEPNSEHPALAVLWRAVRTYMAMLIAAIGSDAIDAFDLDWAQILLLPVVPTVLAVVKNLVAPPDEAQVVGRATVTTRISDVTGETDVHVVVTTPDGVREGHFLADGFVGGDSTS